MNIAEIVKSRKIENIVHFTTNRGSLGVLATKRLKARARLSEDDMLKHIFQVNAADRSRDAAWHDYVNLSISKINTNFFEVSAGAWHKESDFWWCILAFDPVILDHEGVKFATTNNMYSGVVRAPGASGFPWLHVGFSEKQAQENVLKQLQTTSGATLTPLELWQAHCLEPCRIKLHPTTLFKTATIWRQRPSDCLRLAKEVVRPIGFRTPIYSIGKPPKQPWIVSAVLAGATS